MAGIIAKKRRRIEFHHRHTISGKTPGRLIFPQKYNFGQTDGNLIAQNSHSDTGSASSNPYLYNWLMATENTMRHRFSRGDDRFL
jgi:hypothetical protein